MTTSNSRFRLILIPLLMAFAAPAALAAEKLDTLRFGLVPTEDALAVVKQFQGMADHVGKAVGLPTKTWVAQSFNALVEAMHAERIDVSFIGGGQYVAARNMNIAIEPVVVARIDGRTYYKSCIVTRPDSGIKSLSDLKGRTFAFVAPASTSGGVAPQYYLRKNGIDPERDFRSLVWAGQHDSAYLAVKNKKVDAAAVGDVYFARWKERGILEYATYDEPNDKMVSPDLHLIGCIKVPGTPVVVRSALGKEMIAKITKAFLSMPLSTVSQYKAYGKTEEFLPTNDAFYEDLFGMEKVAAELKKKKQ